MEVGQEVLPGMRLRCICRGHTGTIGRIAWSPCGRFIASPSSDTTVRVWDASDGVETYKFTKHIEPVNCVSWTIGDGILASGATNELLLWKVPDTWNPRSEAGDVAYEKTLVGQDLTSVVLGMTRHGPALACLTRQNEVIRDDSLQDIVPDDGYGDDLERTAIYDADDYIWPEKHVWLWTLSVLDGPNCRMKVSREALAKFDLETAWPRAVAATMNSLPEAVDAVTDQLATQGVIVKTKLMTGDEALVLQLPVIERYAGALIIAARNNSRGVPMLEERLLGSTTGIPLPGMEENERIERNEERMVLECIVELMIQHGICFRHGGLLVFPTLFPVSGTDGEKLRHGVSLYYDFTGAIDNIYASLVSILMVSEEFGEGRLRAGSVEFERPGEGVCGILQAKYKGGFAHLDLFFSEETQLDRKDLFTRFVEEHLRQQGVDIREHQAIKCRCGEEISVRIVEQNIARGESDVI